MSEKSPGAGKKTRLRRALVRGGQDWATWLDQAHPAQPFRQPADPSGVALAGAWAALVHLAGREGYLAGRGDCADGDALTNWADRHIHVRRDLPAQQAIAALAHQLAHVLLHAEAAYLSPTHTVACRGIRRAEADSVAYLTARHLGIDGPAITFPRLSGWAAAGPRAHPDATAAAVASRVLGAATQITAHLDAALPEPLRVTPLPAPQPRIGQPDAPAQGRVRSPAAGSVTDPQPRPGDELARVQRAAARFFRGRAAGSWVPGYLTARGFGPAVQRRWQAGYAPAGPAALVRHLRALGYRDTVIEGAGLGRRSWRGRLTDTFRDRAMLPIRGPGGAIVAFIGRAPPGAGPDVPKYLNSPGSGRYRKNQVLFGLAEARRPLATGARPVLAEGPLDAIAVTTASRGRCAGLSPCGTALTARHAAALAAVANLPAAGVLAAFDADPPGRRAAVRAYWLLAPYTDTVAAVTLPPGQDPAQILADRGPAALARILTESVCPLADLVIDDQIGRWSRWLGYAEGQINALRAAARLIAAMPPAHVARQVARAAARLGLPYATVTEAVTDALTAAPASNLRAGGPAALPSWGLCAAWPRCGEQAVQVVVDDGLSLPGRGLAGEDARAR